MTAGSELQQETDGQTDKLQGANITFESQLVQSV
jgi:hypothetical protein